MSQLINGNGYHLRLCDNDSAMPNRVALFPCWF
jgi:hypothetical protein